MSSVDGKMCTIVFGRMDSDYVREVLGHGGINVFPNYEGTCKGCGLFIRAANPDLGLPIPCPNCGTGVKLQHGTSFGEWSHRRIGNERCEFIAHAASPEGREFIQPVVPND